MALINTAIQSAREIASAKRSIINEGLDGYQAKYDGIVQDTNFQAWTQGTEYGATFLDKLNQMISIMVDFGNTELELFDKIDGFLDRQEEINIQGK